MPEGITIIEVIFYPGHTQIVYRAGAGDLNYILQDEQGITLVYSTHQWRFTGVPYAIKVAR